jgi:hypothetical protein
MTDRVQCPEPGCLGCSLCETQFAIDVVAATEPPPRPSPDRAAWLLHDASSAGRLGIDTSQYEELRGEAVALRDELAAERALTDALVKSLPQCDNNNGTHENRPATKAMGRGGARFCDECGGVRPDRKVAVPDYPRAEPLRAIARARAAKDRA